MFAINEPVNSEKPDNSTDSVNREKEPPHPSGVSVIKPFWLVTVALAK